MSVVPGSDADGVSVRAEIEGAFSGELSRRHALAAFAGLAATPLLSALGPFGAGAAGAAVPSAAAGALLSGDSADKIVRGGIRRFSPPFLSPGDRLRLPEGVEVTPLQGFNTAHRNVVPGGPYTWPNVPAPHGGMLDLSIVPERDAPSQMAILSGFRTGWYELTDARGRNAIRVRWNARKMPFLWFWGEWGASKEYPFRGKFYTLGLEPFSRYPVS